MSNREDLNAVSLTGRVLSTPQRISTGDGLVMTFDLVVSKKIKHAPGVKLSVFRVVLFDTLVLKHDEDVFKGALLLVQGELDEAKFFKDATPHTEIRVVARFVKPLGGV